MTAESQKTSVQGKANRTRLGKLKNKNRIVTALRVSEMLEM
jgi:hypothetical protein